MSRKSIYSIMPVGTSVAFSTKSAVFSRVAAEFGYELLLPQYDRDKPAFCLSDLIGKMLTADFIVADLTDERPSCYYELGIAEAIKCPIYLIARVGTAIHQTSKRELVRAFRDFSEYEVVLRELLGECARGSS